MAGSAEEREAELAKQINASKLAEQKLRDERRDAEDKLQKLKSSVSVIKILDEWKNMIEIRDDLVVKCNEINQRIRNFGSVTDPSGDRAWGDGDGVSLEALISVPSIPDAINPNNSKNKIWDLEAFKKKKKDDGHWYWKHIARGGADHTLSTAAEDWAKGKISEFTKPNKKTGKTRYIGFLNFVQKYNLKTVPSTDNVIATEKQMAGKKRLDTMRKEAKDKKAAAKAAKTGNAEKAEKPVKKAASTVPGSTSRNE